MSQPTFSYYRPPARPPSRPAAPPAPPKRKRWLVAGGLLVGLLIFYSVSTHVSQVHAHERQVVADARAKAARQAAEAKVPAAIEAVIAANPTVDFGVSLVDVKTGAQTDVGDSGTFEAGSTAKLVSAAAYLHAVDGGQASLNQTIDGSSATTLLEQMIVNSDDTAWASLNDYLTHPALARYAASLGIQDYNVADNLLSAHDIAGLLQRLANGTLLSHASSQLLLSYMARANYRDYIVPAVPAGDTVYHKIGLVDDVVNDAAIIRDKTGSSVVLVIYTDGGGSYDWPGRAAAMQQITRAVVQGYL